MLTSGKPATQSDVAKAAGVSTATVSRVLNQPESVREDVRTRVRQVMRQLNYVADAAARTLASKRSGTVGAVIPTLSNDIFANGIEAFENTLNEARFSLMLTTSGYSSHQELAQVRMLIERGVDAIMLVGHSHDPLVYELLDQRHIPYVETWAYRNDPQHPCVGFDNTKAALQAPQYLLDLGHQKFAVISGIEADNDRVKDRLTSMQELFAQHNINLTYDSIKQCPYDINAGRQACRQLMAQQAPPTAIVCTNDVLAIGALLECQASGIKVPEQVSITGFDDLPLSANLTPALTTMHIPFKPMGEKAAQFLIDHLNDKQPMANTEVEVKLVVRQSSAPPPS